MIKFFPRFFSIFVDPPARCFVSNLVRPANTFSNFIARDCRFRADRAMISSGLTVPLIFTFRSSPTNDSVSDSVLLLSSSLSSSLKAIKSRPCAMARFRRAASRGSCLARFSRSTNFLILIKSSVVNIRVDDTSCFNLSRSSFVILDKSGTTISSLVASLSSLFTSRRIKSGASSSSSSSSTSSHSPESSIASSSS